MVKKSEFKECDVYAARIFGIICGDGKVRLWQMI